MFIPLYRITVTPVLFVYFYLSVHLFLLNHTKNYSNLVPPGTWLELYETQKIKICMLDFWQFDFLKVLPQYLLMFYIKRTIPEIKSSHHAFYSL